MTTLYGSWEKKVILNSHVQNYVYEEFSEK